ncbi:DUF1002 domain-containing protein [Haloimpatiens sp. FM7315]|uniref:DUF1002 domain-containing protein n=1 Tax=Haloimpatiens sp. FM7315 TaxID=3298609 RepID=UPI00370CEDCF
MNFKTFSTRILTVFLCVFLALGVSEKTVLGDSFKNVTLGGDLTQKQKDEMLKYFGVTRNDANIIEVNIDEERKYLSNVASKEQIGTKSISCSYVEPKSDGGLKVSINNITWVNESIIKNGLVTAGIENADIKVSAPFKVSGTAALTGILKAFESSKGGEKISEDKKKAANQELITTGNLGQKIGQDKAAGLINEIKTEVVKDKPKDKEEVQKIVQNIVNNYNYNLSQEDINKITSLMGKINNLDLNFSEIKNQLNTISNQLEKTLKSDEARNLFQKILDAIAGFFSRIFN